jgi:hypothetical protein
LLQVIKSKGPIFVFRLLMIDSKRVSSTNKKARPAYAAGLFSLSTSILAELRNYSAKSQPGQGRENKVALARGGSA